MSEAFDDSWHPEGAACFEHLHERLPLLRELGPIDWVIVGGSGLGRPLVQPGEHGLGLEILADVPLVELGLPPPSVPGHGSALVIGEVSRVDSPGVERGDRGPVRVAVQTGRIHPYEGHTAATTTALLGALFKHGVGKVLLTCAVGGIAPGLRTGQLVSLRDQIGLFGPTPLRGAAFIDCSNLYDRELRARLQTLAGDPTGLVEVVYGHARGPQYEAPAEVEALRRLGADVVGMSTTYEAVLAAAHRVPCVGLGVVTNAAGSEALSHLEVQQESAKARGRLASLVRGLVRAG